jgi:hypothetical protein
MSDVDNIGGALKPIGRNPCRTHNRGRDSAITGATKVVDASRVMVILWRYQVSDLTATLPLSLSYIHGYGRLF